MEECGCRGVWWCAMHAARAAETRGAKWRDEEAYRQRIAHEAGVAEWERRNAPGYAERVAAERAKLERN